MKNNNCDGRRRRARKLYSISPNHSFCLIQIVRRVFIDIVPGIIAKGTDKLRESLTGSLLSKRPTTKYSQRFQLTSISRRFKWRHKTHITYMRCCFLIGFGLEKCPSKIGSNADMNFSDSGRSYNNPAADMLSNRDDVDSGVGNDFVSTFDSCTSHAENDVYQSRIFESSSSSVLWDRNISGNGENNYGEEENEFYPIRTL